MSGLLSYALADRPVLVADGGTGTSLFAAGLSSGDSPERLNVKNPDLIAQVHRGFIRAGADIILTNTFGGNRERLKLHGLEKDVWELNYVAVRILIDLRRETGGKYVIAGSVGPTGGLVQPIGSLNRDYVESVFGHQIDALGAAGADVIWIETMSCLEEVRLAVSAAENSGYPYVVTMSFDTHGSTMMGVSPADLAEWSRGRTGNLLAVGSNCGIGLGDNVVAVRDLVRAGAGAPAVVKANCGIPEYQNGRLSYPQGPSMMGDYVDLAIRSGARIIGVCCGGTAEHVEQLRHAVDHHQPVTRVTRSEVQRRLGGVSALPGARARTRRRSGRATA